MKRQLSFFILLCVWTLSLQAQSAEENFYDAIFFFEEDEDYQEAAYLFYQVLSMEPDNANVKYLLGRCYINIEGSEHRAIPFLQQSTRDINLKYKDKKFSEKRAPHHAWFYLAEAYSKTNQMDEALDALNKFKDLKEFDRKYNYRITEEAVLAVERAKIIKDAEIPLRALYFNEPINSPSDDYNGVISGDGRVMVWANSKTFYEAIYMSVRANNQWGIPVLITPQVVSDGDLFPTGLSFDGTSLLLIKTNKRGNKDIWISQFNGNTWSPAGPIEGEINSNGNEDHASFSPDGRYIYLSSDRRGGEGGLDLWVSERLGNGEWGEPRNMGDQINTDMDESSVFVSPDGQRLIFASKGHFNMGGYDIFRCELEGNNIWSQPTNIGYPLNTTGDNTFYVPINSGLQALYTRFTNEGIGKRDLWYVEILDMESFVSNDLTLAEDPPGISQKDFAIILVNNETGEEIEVLYDSATDSFKALTGEKSSYRVISYKQK
ncbi:MAG: tetratricopeptide repeat protein [Bacteroidales bacterium]|nr:tetratricopeptide repeat protein [Bacteroidales bacterium]